jgi:hypothetical protein
MLRFKHVVGAALVALAAGCGADAGSLVGPEGGPLPTVSDAAHAGAVPGFYFLPPMVAPPSFGGTFDAALSPRVEICEVVAASCSTVMATYTTTTGPGSETVRLDAAQQSYAVNWHTNNFNLDPTKHYRISVFVGTLRLGYADVDVVGTGKELKNVDTNQYIPLVDGRTLPVKFRIETGIVAAVAVAPASATINAGQTQQFTATLTDLHGNTATAPVAWTTSSAAVATIVGTGLATGVAPGTVTVTATSGGASGTATLVVVNPNTPPVANADAFDAIGNVTVPVAAPGVLANDTDAENNTLTVTAGTIATAGGGTVTLNADGSFTYLGAAGFTGSDSFQYEASDGSATATGTVTMTVNGRVWYVNNSAAAPGDGRDASPFTTLAAAGGASGPGETIFLLAGSGTTAGYDQGITLKAGQALTGQGVASDITASLNGQSVVLLAAGSAPSITRSSAGPTIQLATGNTVQGVSVASTAGAGIAGSAFGTFTAGSVSVGAVGGPALDLQSGSVAAAFGSLSSTGSSGTGLRLHALSGTLTAPVGSISGAAGTAVEVSGGDASISYGGSITNAVGRAVSVTGRSGGSLVLSGSIVETGTGILVSGNTGGTISFTGPAKTLDTGASTAFDLQNNTGATINVQGGGLSITTTSGDGFSATGGGTVNVTGAGNQVAAGTGRAVSLQNVSLGALGVTFRSVSASGGANGIVLGGTGAAGGFKVTGDGSTAGSGGTIQNTSSDGVRLVNAHNVTLGWMSFSGIASGVTNAAACNASLASGCESAIDLSGATNVTLDHVTINGAGQAGISAFNSSGLTLTNSQVLNVGDADGESGILLHNLSGASLIQDVTVDNPEDYGIRLFNTGGTAGLTLRRVTVQNNLGTFGKAGFHAQVSGGTTTALVDDSDFLNTDGSGVAGTTSSSGTLNLTVQASTFTNNQALPSGINFTTAGSSVGRLSATGNVINGCATLCSMGIDLDAASTSTLDAVVLDNTVANAGVGTGIEFISNENAVARGRFEGNNVTVSANRLGFNFQARSVGVTQSGSLDLTLKDNTINGITSSAAVVGGMSFQAGASGTLVHNNSMCVNLATGQSAGSNVVNGTNNPPLVFAYTVRQRVSTVFKFQGYGGTASSPTDLEAYVTANNPGGTMGGSAEVFDPSGTTVVNYTSGTCATPSAAPAP